MNADERSKTEDELSILEPMLMAIDRREEVFRVVEDSEDMDEAIIRLATLLGSKDPISMHAIADMQVCRWTKAERRRIALHVDELRGRLGRS